MLAYNSLSMRRGVAIAAFALILAVPLWAQRGGGGHFGGGGHAGGFGGGHFGGGGFAGHGFGGGPGVHSFSGSGVSHGFSHLPPTFGFNHPPTGGFNPPPTRGFTPPTSPLVRQPYRANGFARGGLARGGFARNGLNRGGFDRGGFGRNGFDRDRDRGDRHHDRFGWQFGSYPYWSWGYGWGYPYWGWSYFDPWWYWWDSEDNNNYDNSDYQNNLATAEQMNEDSLRQQQMLQQEQTDGDQDAYQNAYDQGFQDARAQDQPDRYNDRDRYNQYASVRPPLDPERMQQAEQSQRQPANAVMRSTVLVFRDRHEQEVENYAIVGETLWNFAPRQTVKIPLSELDIPATVKANQDRGVTFTVPDA